MLPLVTLARCRILGEVGHRSLWAASRPVSGGREVFERDMPMIWLVIFVVLMIFWLFFGAYVSWDPARPQAMGTTIIPWLCVAILGLVVFGAVTTAPMR